MEAIMDISAFIALLHPDSY